jgi:lipopolysaccharide export system permease protein
VTVVCRQALRELAWTFLVTSVVLLLVGVAGRFLGYLQDAALGRYTADAVLAMIALRVPEYCALTLPLSLYLSCVFVVSRAHADHETTVLWAAGASPLRYYGWFAAAAVLVGTVVAAMSMVLSPAAAVRFETLVAAERMRQAFAAMTPNEFHRERGAHAVTYAEDVAPDSHTLLRVFIATRDDAGRDVVVVADRGTQVVSPSSDSRFLRLESGRRYEGTAGSGSVRVVEFRTLSQRLETGGGRVSPQGEAATPTQVLDPSTPGAAAELHWRIALPIMCVLGVFVAVGIARVAPGEGRFARLPRALVVFFLYYVALLANRSALAAADLPPAFGFWSVHAAFAVAGWLLARRFARPLGWSGV